MSDFATALRALREQDGLRQQDLVDALDGVVARSTLANIENGRQVPSPAFLDALGSRFPA